ncbi:MAG: hypothetical protein EBZ48_07860 [Proteobacteria bacterium]|nr:hypothetical protein [Pseudomonadota bacterium]
MKQSLQSTALNLGTSLEVAEMAKVAFTLLNHEVTVPTQRIMVSHGMPSSEKATVGTILEMSFARELPLLDQAPESLRGIWEDWATRLLVLYKLHLTSDQFLGNPDALRIVQHLEIAEHLTPPKLPLSRSDFQLLSFSPEIVRAISDCTSADHRSLLGEAFAAELDNCAYQFKTLADLALTASQKLAA